MEGIQKQELTSMDIKKTQLQKLKELFPEAFTEGLKVDWDKLRLTLGDDADTGKERYGMNWPGKADCFKTIQRPSIAALIPAREESIGFDTTQNLFIEGDNLEVLKLLQKSYWGKIKMIYIDPPYNTGNDFIYPDNYSENLNTYLEYTGQIDGEGRRFAANTETDGRFHSKWMNMMYPRLFLAKNMLSEDGVIFISIGDQELHNLRALMNDIFGEENYINTVCVKAKPSAGASGGGEDKRLKKNVEFLMIYAKNREFDSIDLNQAFDEIDLFEHINNYVTEGKSWKYTRVLSDFGNRKYAGTAKDGDGNDIKLYVHADYKFNSIKELTSKSKTEQEVYKENFGLVFRDTNAQSSIRARVMEALGSDDGLFSIEYTPRSGRSKGKLTTVYYKGRGKDQIAWLKDIARKEAEHIFIKGKTGTLWADFNWNNLSKEGDVAFPNGKKPISFIQRMIDLSTKPNESHMVLDFFAGSASTAHAVLDKNCNDNGNRKFILVQLPKDINDKEFNTISALSKKRLRNSIQKLQESSNEETLFDNAKKIDLGFKSFVLSPSSFRVWDAALERAPEAIQQKLFEHIRHISPEAQQEAILYELLLKSGFELTAPIETLTLADKTVFSIAEGQLLICLEKEITHDCIKAMAEKQPSRAICLDEAFTGANADALKTNAVQIMKSKGVVNFRTV